MPNAGSSVLHGRFLRLRGFSQGLPDDRQEFGIIHGFFEKGLRPGLDSALLVWETGATRDHDDRNHAWLALVRVVIA